MKMWNWKYYLASMWNRICSCFWQHIPILFDIPSLLKSDQTKRKNLICNILQAVWRSETLCTKLDPRVHHSCPSRSCLRLKSSIFYKVLELISIPGLSLSFVPINLWYSGTYHGGNVSDIFPTITRFSIWGNFILPKLTSKNFIGCLFIICWNRLLSIHH